MGKTEESRPDESHPEKSRRVNAIRDIFTEPERDPKRIVIQFVEADDANIFREKTTGWTKDEADSTQCCRDLTTTFTSVSSSDQELRLAFEDEGFAKALVRDSGGVWQQDSGKFHVRSSKFYERSVFLGNFQSSSPPDRTTNRSVTRQRINTIERKASERRSSRRTMGQKVKDKAKDTLDKVHEVKEKAKGKAQDILHPKEEKDHK